MKLFKIGKIVSIGKTYIILESNFNGYIVYVSNPEEFEKDKVMKVYIYEHVSEYQKSIYGFKSFKERILFEDLISVNGIGPKTAISALKLGVENLIAYISQGDANGLSTLPQIGTKTANQIIFELRGKYENMTAAKTNRYLPNDISNTLKTLGFTSKQIEYAIQTIKPSDSIELMVEEAIKAISGAKFTSAK